MSSSEGSSGSRGNTNGNSNKYGLGLDSKGKQKALDQDTIYESEGYGQHLDIGTASGALGNAESRRTSSTSAYRDRFNSTASAAISEAGDENAYLEDEGVHEELNDARRFEDFETIDWIQDTLFERSRRIRENRESSRRLAASRFSSSPRTQQLRAWCLSILHATQSWLVVTLVGAGIGVNAALIDVVTSWLTDLKFGYCRVSWWLNSKFCCWEIDPVGSMDDANGKSAEELCEDWQSWSEVFFGLGYLVYIGYAIAFAFSAAYIVRSFAPYAAGSGISEIKCILAGFVMKGYLALATLIIKSITLVGERSPFLRVGK
jgi:chloride channel 3/4/5